MMINKLFHLVDCVKLFDCVSHCYVFVHISLPCFVCGSRWIELSNIEPERTMNEQLESHLHVHLLTMTHLLQGRSGLLRYNMYAVRGMSNC